MRGCLQEEIDERLLRLGRESRESSIQGGREALSGGAGLLGELKVVTKGSSASPFIVRRSGNSSQLQPPPLMAETVAGRRLVGVAERERWH